MGVTERVGLQLRRAGPATVDITLVSQLGRLERRAMRRSGREGSHLEARQAHLAMAGQSVARR
jgi:hypothetical protein